MGLIAYRPITSIGCSQPLPTCCVMRAQSSSGPNAQNLAISSCSAVRLLLVTLPTRKTARVQGRQGTGIGQSSHHHTHREGWQSVVPAPPHTDRRLAYHLYHHWPVCLGLFIIHLPSS